ncbi:MAG: hypothetical protein EOM76_08735 [Sphingobacteriia bacterium]|jgi:hypothetical protein|nr:hypothetical protein [Sphingobacteriia bacterium]
MTQMRNRDFSNIRTLADIDARKTSLRSSLYVQEQLLKHDVSRIQKSWKIMPHLISTVQNWIPLASPALRLFFTGYQFAHKLFVRKHTT